MSATDPLTLRHGTLISSAWRDINFARQSARNGAAPQPQLTRLRATRKRIVAAHEAELLRAELPTKVVDDWFAEVETVLTRGEAYFRDQALPQPPHMQPPTKPPARLYPLNSAGTAPA